MGDGADAEYPLGSDEDELTLGSDRVSPLDTRDGTSETPVTTAVAI